jgi:hypothetical protein
MSLGNCHTLLNLSNIPLYDKNTKSENIIIKTKISTVDIERKLNKILDKQSETCCYYLLLNDYTYVSSFNHQSVRSFEDVIKYMIEISIYKHNDYSVLEVSKIIEDIEPWREIYSQLLNLK